MIVLPERHRETKTKRSFHPDKSFTTFSTKLLIDREIISRREMNVKAEGDTQSNPVITGCAVMPSGHIMLCDGKNKHVKLLDNSWRVSERLKLPDPFDVSVIDPNNAIVSLPSQGQLQIVQVFPKMKAVRTIKLDTPCFGVAVSCDEIYTACSGKTCKEVRVLDLRGNIKRRLRTNTHGFCLFDSPFYITVSASGERVFVSDDDRETITCLSSCGRVIYTYKSRDMYEPSGLLCDSGGNLLVCGDETNNIHAISPDGNKCRVLAYEDGLLEPKCISYKESAITLIVGCCQSYNLLLFKLA